MIRRRWVCCHRLALPDGGEVLLCADLPKQLKRLLAWEARIRAAAGEGRKEAFFEACFGLLGCLTDAESLERAVCAFGGRIGVCEAVDEWVRKKLLARMCAASASERKRRMREAGRRLR